jgi:hypothetical protein
MAMAERLPVARIISTRNLDVASLIRRLDRTLVEITKSQSSGVSGTLPFDFTRLEEAIKMLKSFKAFAEGLPFMDTPETTPIIINVDCYGTIPPIENDSAWDMAQIVDTMMQELAGSQSSNIGNGFLPPHDGKRFDDYVARLEKLIAHSKGTEPVDYPESSPRAVSTGPGVTGINDMGSTR